MIVEALRLINMLLSLLGSLRQPMLTMVVDPLITVAVLVCLYAGWHIRDEGSVSQGLRVAFVDTRADREAEQQEFVSILLQAELHRFATTGRLIDQLLAALLQHAPGAARVRLGVIHNGVTGLTGITMLRYDIINAIAPPGRAAGELIVNQPLATWSDYLPNLLAGKCEKVMAADVHNYALRVRLLALGANGIVTCPVTDIEGKLLGAVFVDWDGADLPPDGDQLQALVKFDERIAAQIASVLNLRSGLDVPPGGVGKRPGRETSAPAAP